jgi:formylglycine-generating enzyme required for sulfatase activity
MGVCVRKDWAEVMNEYLSRRSGFSLLCISVAFAALWLSTRGTAALQPIVEPVPPLTQSDDLDRFRADAWYLPNEPLLGFVEIPAGIFVMGSSPDENYPPYANERWTDESDQGKIELPAYFIGRYEVTVAQYRAFVAATGYRFKADALGGAPTHPIAQVKWTDALAYAHWLEATLRDHPRVAPSLTEKLRNGWHITLPSEAQWEKAARGGDGRIFPWGNTRENQYANFGGQHTNPVGALKCLPCAYQLADMSGNVWEMTRSPNVPYPFDDLKRGDLDAYALYVMRGGSYSDSAQNARAAIRGAVDTDTRSPTIGFRLVISR